MSTFPAPQEKPARLLNYQERQREAIKAGSVERKPRKRIKAVSSKRQREGAEYTRLRTEFLKAHPVCQIPGCTSRYLEIHHKARRGKFFLRTDTWMAVCGKHHQWIEDHPAWSKTHGYLLTPEQRRAIA